MSALTISTLVNENTDLPRLFSLGKRNDRYHSYHCAIQFNLVFVPLVLVSQVPESAHMCVSLWTGYSVNNLFQQEVAVDESNSKQLSFMCVAKLLKSTLTSEQPQGSSLGSQ